MKSKKLHVSLAALAAVAMLMALAGCGHDRRDDGHNRDRLTDRERRDMGRHDEYRASFRHDGDRGDR